MFKNLYRMRLEEGSETPSGGTDTPATGEDNKAPAPVPYSRFKEINEKKNELAAKLEAAEAKLKAATDKEMEETAQYKQLAEERRIENEKLTARVTIAETALSKYRETMTATVDDTSGTFPDEVKAFDPGAEAEPLERWTWMIKSQALVTRLNEKSTAQAGSPGTTAKPAPKVGVHDPAKIELPINVRTAF